MESKRQVKNGYQMDMVHGPLAGKILLFALPLMFSSRISPVRFWETSETWTVILFSVQTVV